MAIRVKTGASTWSNVTELKVKTAINTWSNIIRARVKTAASVWSDFFIATVTPTVESRSTISLSGGINASNNIMNDTTFVTITSTRYHWNDADGFTYVWQYSSDNSIWYDIGSAQSTTNPASGASSSSITKTLSPSDFTSGPNMYFRFKFMATSSTYSTNASSESLSQLVSYYGTPTPNSPFPSITGSTTVGNTAYGNIGTWTNSPTSYDYRWFFMSGATSYPLTFSQSRSVSNKTLSGFLAVLTTSANHGYKASDIITVSSMDSLFNKSNATISSVTSNTITYTVNTPTAWANAGTAYSSGTFVSSSGNAYAAASTISSVSVYSSVTTYSSGAIVYSGNNRYQSNLNSNINHPVTDVIWWNNLGSYAPVGSQWTLQSFSNTATSGTTTAPNYYEGTVSSSTSISLTVPTTDYKSTLDMIAKALYFGVKAYNPATLSPSEYSNYKLVYGVPVIALGTPTYPSGTQAQIPFTQSYMTSYNIDVVRAGVSHTGYPTTISSSTSPINISGLTAGFTYTVNVYPINGEGTYGGLQSTTITLPSPISAPTISSITVSVIGGPVSVSFTGGSGPFYQIFWWGTATAPTGLTTADASGTSSPLTDNTGPTSTATQYMYVRSTSTQFESGVGPSSAASAWSAGVSFNMNPAPALTPTFGANTSTANGFTGSVTNYDSAYNWNTPSNGSFTLTNGTWTWGTASGSTRPFTVTGLSSSQSSTATVTTTRADYTSGSASTTGTALTTIIPTITMSANSGVAQTTGTINWTSTNQASFSSSGTISGSGTTQTSVTNTSLSAGTNYTGTVTVTSSTGNTASANYSLTTSQYTVIFNANGGTGTMANQTANTATNLTAFGFTPPAGKGFSGWATSSGGSVVYANQASYPFTASTTLYAIYYTLPTAPSAPSPSVTSGPTQTTVTISWSAPADGGSAITRYEAQLGSSGYSNIGNVLTQSLTGLTASTSYTYSVRAVNAVGTSSAGSVSFTMAAAPVVPSVTQIQSTNTNAGPTFMSFAITCANALSCDVRVDRAPSAASPPTFSYTAGTSTLLTLSGGVGTVNSTTTTPPAGSNAWYRIRVIPYTGASRTGTAGTQVASSWKRNTATSTTTTNPSPTPFGNASV